MGEDFRLRIAAIFKAARHDALMTVMEMELPCRIPVPQTVSGLCAQANEQYAITYSSLQERHGDGLPALFAYAQWVKWIACWDGAHSKRRMGRETVDTHAFADEHCTAADHARAEGWAYTVFNKAAAIGGDALYRPMIERFGLKDSPSNHDALLALGIHWLWQASDGDLSRADLLEVLHEAADARALADGQFMWDEGERAAVEDLSSDPNSKAARAAGRVHAQRAVAARHAKMRKMCQEVVARYKIERSGFASKDDAAYAYTKEYAAAFSTIRDWLKGV